MAIVKSNELLPLIAFVVSAGLGCVAEQPVVTNCPCADGWIRDASANICRPSEVDAGTGGGSGTGGVSGTGGAVGTGGAIGTGGATGGGGTGGSIPATGGVGGAGYKCGPDRSLDCACGTVTWLPAPVDAQGQPQTTVLPPDKTTLVPYATSAAFDALAVGRWKRTAGQAELRCESVGVEITADHQLIPLAWASDGSIQSVNALAEPFVLQVSSNQSGGSLVLNGGALTTNAPTFFDGGQSMQLTYDPWPANYQRLAPR